MKTPLGADLVIPALALGFAAYFFVSIADLAWEAKANGVVIGGVLVVLDRDPGRAHRDPRAARGEASLRLRTRFGSRARRSASASAWCSVTVAFIATLQLARPDARPAAGAVRRALDHGSARQAAGHPAGGGRARRLPAVRRPAPIRHPARARSRDCSLDLGVPARPVRDAVRPVVGDPARDPARHRGRHPAGLQPAEHAHHAAAAHARGAGGAGDGVHDRALLREPSGRRHPGDPGEDPRLGRRRGDHARRLPDDAEGPGAAGAGALLHRLGVRRADHHARHHRAAAVALADRPVPALGGDGGGHALRPDADRGDRRQGPAEGADRRLLRPADRRDRHRPHLQHAARHLRLSRALRRRAAGAGADRPVRHLRGAGDDRGEDDRRPGRARARAARALGRHARGPAPVAAEVVAHRLDLVRRPVHRHHARRRREHRRVRRLPAVAPVVEASRALRHRHSRRA